MPQDNKSVLFFYNSIGVDFTMESQTKIKKHDICKDLALLSTLDQLKEAVFAFDGCDLKKNATNTVFCDGDPASKIMLIGEAPGEQEDLRGIPFCGRSGKLLDKMLEAIGLNRNCVYITNTVFWRPPGNRKPSFEETAICRPFLEHHIRLVAPKLIILVGGTAASSVLDTNVGVSQLRGKFYQYSNRYIGSSIAATVIFHPAYLLRQPMQKKLAWEDLQSIRKYLDDSSIV